MRIRSTKPEFWRSRTIASVSWDARLMLKALESYVDDNGVGKDDMELIVMQTFSRDQFRNPTGTVRRVSEAVSELTQAELVTRYEANGEPLLYVERWKDHQYVQKPQKGRFPRPDGTYEYSETVNPEAYRTAPEASGNSPAWNRGSGEQGTGEQEHMVTTSGGDRETEMTLIPPEESGPSHEDMFHDFWKHWPRKVKKPEALAAFLKAAKREKPLNIIDGAQRYAADPNLPETQFIPHPATWLNNDQWNDGPLPPRTNGQQSTAQRRQEAFAALAERWNPAEPAGEIEQ